MMDDIQATFRHRFTTTARTRVAFAMDATTRSDYAALQTAVRELHSLAGEAGLLGFSQFVPVAREGEERAKRMFSERTPATREAMTVTLHELERMIDELATTA